MDTMPMQDIKDKWEFYKEMYERKINK